MKNYALKIVNEKFQSHNYFQWPTEGEVICPDWEPTKECGNGLHAFLNGEGDINTCSISLDTANFLLLEISEYIDLNGKIKFEKCKVLKHSKNISEIHELIREKIGRTNLESIKYSKTVEGKAFIVGGYKSTITAGNESALTAGHRSTLTAGLWSALTAGHRSTITAGHRSTLTAGDNSTLTAGNGSTLTAGHRSTLTAGDESALTAGYGSTLKAGDNSALTAGYGSTLKAGDNSTLTAGDESTLTVYGNICYIIKNGENCSLIQYGNKKYMLDLDELLKDFKVGDKVKIENGKVITEKKNKLTKWILKYLNK